MKQVTYTVYDSIEWDMFINETFKPKYEYSITDEFDENSVLAETITPELVEKVRLTVDVPAFTKRWQNGDQYDPSLGMLLYLLIVSEKLQCGNYMIQRNENL